MRDNIKMCLVLLIVVIACNNIGTNEHECNCFNKNKITFIPFIGIDRSKLNNDCEYYLNTLDVPPKDTTHKRLCFENGLLKIKAGFPFKSYDIIYSSKDTIGTTRFFHFSEITQFDCSGASCYDNRLIKVELENYIRRNNEIIKVLKFYNFKMREAEELNDLVLKVFFSDSDGFIGCYLYQSANPSVIFGIQGDILKGIIDYSDISFHKLG